MGVDPFNHLRTMPPHSRRPANCSGGSVVASNSNTIRDGAGREEEMPGNSRSSTGDSAGIVEVDTAPGDCDAMRASLKPEEAEFTGSMPMA